MDERLVDHLGTRLAAPRARRAVLTNLIGGLAASLLARVRPELAAAASCPSQVRCGQGPTAVCCRNATDTCTGGRCQSSTRTCPAGGDASTPRYRCTASRGFACDCATEERTGNFVCFGSSLCADCTNPSTPCPSEQSCVEASDCAHGAACVTLCT